MLNKEICKRCNNERFQAIGGFGNFTWSEEDEIKWGNGRVWCRAFDVNVIGKYIFTPPDDHCPYFLEQTLFHEMTK